MTLAVSGKIALSVSLRLSNPQNLSSGSKVLNKSYEQNYTSGSSADQASTEWDDTRTLAASTSENIDLSGVLLDVFGNKIADTKLREIIIVASESNTNNIEVGGAGSNAFLLFKDATDIAVIEPGGKFYMSWPNTGRTVTAATGDILKIANAGAGSSVTYDIIVVGVGTLTPAS